jgi:hypothetical protein
MHAEATKSMGNPILASLVPELKSELTKDIAATAKAIWPAAWCERHPIQHKDNIIASHDKAPGQPD